jgi:acylphosphatase
MEISLDKARVYLKIEGRVQGVYFRASTVAEAQRLGVTGWVMNSYDGSVEVVAEGARASLEQLESWCRHGPPGAQVANLDVQWEQPQDTFTGFTIRRR